ncbi:uncharacterized protein JCM10292_005945 [Rhodotorula paludigena]|uniref:uncharacterized protein n=1 Tax=Rhodotorula paludigena TaxID=86838 RepID=UPI00317F07D7
MMSGDEHIAAPGTESPVQHPSLKDSRAQTATGALNSLRAGKGNGRVAAEGRETSIVRVGVPDGGRESDKHEAKRKVAAKIEDIRIKLEERDETIYEMKRLIAELKAFEASSVKYALREAVAELYDEITVKEVLWRSAAGLYEVLREQAEYLKLPVEELSYEHFALGLVDAGVINCGVLPAKRPKSKPTDAHNVVHTFPIWVAHPALRRLCAAFLILVQHDFATSETQTRNKLAHPRPTWNKFWTIHAGRLAQMGFTERSAVLLYERLTKTVIDFPGNRPRDFAFPPSTLPRHW